ncbi:MAG: ATP--guanido phosphotransferase, partial [Planctomycetes bacterium]|nr:ATP--guanido phosphotransferase [Planctomycetota bacterium]
MTLDDLARTTGEWLSCVGPLSDVVISSRIRLARNLAGYPFLSMASASERAEVYRVLSERIASTSVGRDALHIDVEAADPVDRQILVERQLISRQHAVDEGSRGVSVALSEVRALMINEED